MLPNSGQLATESKSIVIVIHMGMWLFLKNKYDILILLQVRYMYYETKNQNTQHRSILFIMNNNKSYYLYGYLIYLDTKHWRDVP